MRKSLVSTRQHQRLACSSRTASASASRFAPSIALTLPTVPRAIPSRFVVSQNRARIATLAQGLLDFGILEWNEADPLEGITKSLSEWATRESECAPWLQNIVRITFSDSLDQMATNAEPNGLSTDGKGAFALIHGITAMQGEYGQPVPFALAGPISALEERHSRLGATILSLLEYRLNSAITCFGPHCALGVASTHHWMGEWDDKFAREQLEAQGENPEDFDMLTSEAFYINLPEWLFKFKPLSRFELQLIAQRDPEVAPAIKAALAVQKAPCDKNNGLYSCGYVPTVILFWHEYDLVGELYDLMVNDHLESGVAHEIAQFAIFDPDSPKSITSALRDLARHFAALRTLQPLLTLTTNPVIR